MRQFVVLLFLIATTLGQIEEQTFREFFKATFDLDDDGEFTYSDWVSYFLFLEHDL